MSKRRRNSGPTLPPLPGNADAQGEYSIEIDPRTVSPARVEVLRRQGFNRLIKAARLAALRSVSIDLI